jgi:hypothetical protein
MPEIRKDRLKLRSGEEKSWTPDSCASCYTVSGYSPKRSTKNTPAGESTGSFRYASLHARPIGHGPGQRNRLLFQQNYRLHQGKFATLAYATLVLRYGRMKRNHQAWLGPVKRDAAARLSGIWFALLNATRSVRHKLGLHSRGVRR